MSRLYSQAAAVLGPSLQTDHGRQPSKAKSLKSRTYDDQVTNKRMTHLLVNETLKHRALLDQVLQEAKLSLDKLSPNTALAYILLYELLLGKSGKIEGGGSLKRALLDNEKKLRKSLEMVLKRYPHLVPLKSDEESMNSVPKYCRINTLKCNKSVDQIAQEFEAEVDEHVPFLLKLAPNVDMHDHPMVKFGEIILQDKSSCFPVAALAEEMKRRQLLSFDCIDCCAAPGNKTTQLAALVATAKTKDVQPKVFAFDRSKDRFELLKRRVQLAGAQEVVTPICQDFLKTDPSDPQFNKVRTILLDPSCSGSGSFSVERIYEKNALQETDARVDKLAEFQLTALTHALSFPQAQLISYSTCSIFHKENEMVVRKALDEFGNEWELLEALPQWKRRGVSLKDGLNEQDSRKVARADFQQGDATGGFFVALFGRTHPATQLKAKIKEQETASKTLEGMSMEKVKQSIEPPAAKKLKVEKVKQDKDHLAEQQQPVAKKLKTANQASINTAPGGGPTQIRKQVAKAFVKKKSKSKRSKKN